MKMATSSPSSVSAARVTTGWLVLNPVCVSAVRHAIARIEGDTERDAVTDRRGADQRNHRRDDGERDRDRHR